MPILDISVIPVGTNQASFSSFVVESCKIAERQGLKYQITPTGTVIEGTIGQLMNIAQQMHEAPFRLGAQRVITNITIDERHDKEMNMENQIQAVEENIQ